MDICYLEFLNSSTLDMGTPRNTSKSIHQCSSCLSTSFGQAWCSSSYMYSSLELDWDLTSLELNWCQLLLSHVYCITFLRCCNYQTFVSNLSKRISLAILLNGICSNGCLALLDFQLLYLYMDFIFTNHMVAIGLESFPFFPLLGSQHSNWESDAEHITFSFSSRRSSFDKQHCPSEILNTPQYKEKNKCGRAKPDSRHSTFAKYILEAFGRATITFDVGLSKFEESSLLFTNRAQDIVGMHQDVETGFYNNRFRTKQSYLIRLFVFCQQFYHLESFTRTKASQLVENLGFCVIRPSPSPIIFEKLHVRMKSNEISLRVNFPRKKPAKKAKLTGSPKFTGKAGKLVVKLRCTLVMIY